MHHATSQMVKYAWYSSAMGVCALTAASDYAYVQNRRQADCSKCNLMFNYKYINSPPELRWGLRFFLNLKIPHNYCYRFDTAAAAAAAAVEISII